MEAYLVSQLEDLFPSGELSGGIYSMTSLGIGPHLAVPERPYLVWKELSTVEYPSVSELSDVEQRSFQIFVYDYKGDFTRINNYLARIKRLVKGMAPFEFVDEDDVLHRCTGSSWGGMSALIADDGYDSGARYGIARFTVSQNGISAP